MILEMLHALPLRIHVTMLEKQPSQERGGKKNQHQGAGQSPDRLVGLPDLLHIGQRRNE